MRFCAVLLALASCGGDESALQPCTRQPFALWTRLPEASGAAWLTIDGTPTLAVVADSGNHGAYALLDPDTGETREDGELPLGGPGEDLEGFAAHGDRVFGLTSDGWMRVWQRTGNGFALVDGPYAIGNVVDGTTCTRTRRRWCDINYEGLALAAAPQNGCAGFACSKGDGNVYCLTERAGRYAIDRSRRIAVTDENLLGDCSFDDSDQLWVANNGFGGNQVFRIDGWATPATAKVMKTSAVGILNSEVIAVRGNTMYRMSDSGASPSLLAKYRCSSTH